MVRYLIFTEHLDTKLIKIDKFDETERSTKLPYLSYLYDGGLLKNESSRTVHRKRIKCYLHVHFVSSSSRYRPM